MGGLAGVGLAGDDIAPRQGHRRARQAPWEPCRWPVAHAPHRFRDSQPSRLLSRVVTDYAFQFNLGFALDPERLALVVVDLQYASASRLEGLGRALKDQGQEALGAYRFDRIERVVVPTVKRLLGFFRTQRLRVIYLTVGSELPDYSDLLPHMRAFAEVVGNTRGRREHEVLDEVRPAHGEPVLNKTTMSAFHSSGFERLLRSWGVEQLLFTGVSTNSCVEGTARDAADRGYRCLIVEDGCGAASQRLHEAACENFRRLLGRVESSATVMAELTSALARSRTP
ncbi:MAG: cysteine hydrolase [Candidatus Rokuibacteriota bacterium]|nr:MAG: cysteine hydrolase [Candidatus Rokubacteria bacterium]